MQLHFASLTISLGHLFDMFRIYRSKFLGKKDLEMVVNIFVILANISRLLGKDTYLTCSVN